MGDYKVYPHKLEGNVKIPPSKSMAHRAVICAALSDGVSRLTNIDYSDDIIATIKAMESLGAIIINKDEYLEVTGINNKDNKIKDNINENRIIDCNESGSTLRFLVPIASLFDGVNNFIGRGNLGKRPLDTYYNIFDEQGIKYTYKEGILDLKTEGRLKAGEFRVKGNISSQFITGLLFTLPLLDGDSKIIITTEMESKGYIDLTLSAMKDFGVEIINNDYKEFIVKGNQTYKSRDYRVEGDYSQAAFYLCADALCNKIKADDLKLDSLQGDKEVIDILERMGVSFNTVENGLIGKVDGKLKSTQEILPLEDVLIDGKDHLDTSGLVLRDRQTLSTDGALIVGIVLNNKNKAVLGGPDIQSRGVIYLKDSENIMKEVGNILESTIERLVKEKKYDNISARNEARDLMSKYIYKQTGKRPMILPVIIEIRV